MTPWTDLGMDMDPCQRRRPGAPVVGALTAALDRRHFQGLAKRDHRVRFVSSQGAGS